MTGNRVTFQHQKETAYFCKPDAPDPVYARKLQELIGDQWGEMSVMVSRLFQGWNCRGPAKHKEDGFEDTPCPATFPQGMEDRHAACRFLDHSRGTESRAGRRASGPSMAGRGSFEYVETVPAGGDAPVPGVIDPQVRGTGLTPMPPQAAPLAG